jgi:hypothetical protein
MKKFLPFPPEDAAPNGNPAPGNPAADRKTAHERILGQTDAERIEQHIATLRCFTELALQAAKRLNDRETERAERIAMHAAEHRMEGTPPAEAEESAAETSAAIHRLSRTARLNIALEQKLVEALRNPEPSGKAPRGRRDQAKQAEQEAHLAAQKEAVRDFVEEWAPTDPNLDRERVDELLAELRNGLDAGWLDEQLLTEDARKIGYLFMYDRKIDPNYCNWPVKGSVQSPAVAAAEPARTQDAKPSEPAPPAAGAQAPSRATAPSTEETETPDAPPDGTGPPR